MMASEDTLPESEWSYFVDVDSIEDERQSIRIEADGDERAALARRLGVTGIQNLKADVTVDKGTGGFQVHVSGVLHATLLQDCVVTGEPIETVLEEPFEGWFADAERAVNIVQAKTRMMHKKGHTEMPITEERDDPEPIIDGHIDVGELAAQFLSLSINPYPHAPGALPEDDDGVVHKDEVADERKNPFAALKNWKERHGSGD